MVFRTLFTAAIYQSFIALIILLTSALATTATADTLVIPNISSQPSTSPQGIPRPARAMTMEQVREQFGAPQEVLGPVGDPPITRWVYDRIVVHFEGEYVIHSVIKK